MTYDEIRKTFFEYFEQRGHKVLPSASLIPDDPTLMFTVAGMVPFKKIFQGMEPAPAPRVVNSQKCLRAGGKHNDLDEVGFDGSHHTFFEMLGNWSFGDYFKQGAIEMSWDFLTNVLKLDPVRIRVTTHHTDDEATEIWRTVAGKEAIRLGDKDNWWSAGDVGPCGPCTEIFYDMGDDIVDDDKRWIEIWNNVFMQYDRDADGKLTPLPKQNVDTGAGLERWAAILQGVRDNYDTDLFVNLIRATEELTGVKKTPENTPSFKVIADHLRAVGFAIADGVIPSNIERGYVIRRILRRAMRHGQILGHRGALLSKLYPALVSEMGEWYPELKLEQARVVETIEKEERAFETMLVDGLKLLDKSVSDSVSASKILPGDIAFKLYDTYGFPLDLTETILRERGIDVDVAGFEKCMAQQKERSRSSQVFKSGLADHDDPEITKLHTATHLLHAALRQVLGDGVAQRGSNITAERLRFDFSFDRKMEPDEIAAVEKLVNDAIAANAPITCTEMSVADAKAMGAIGLFESKYGDVVKVYTMGDFSREICGGPHANNTGELGGFKIQKEESSASGVRRIKAVIGK